MATLLKPIRTLDEIDASISIDFEVVTCFIEYNDKFLVLQRARKDEQFGLWGIPGGKLEKNECPRAGLSREIFEETNILICSDAFQFLERAHSYNRYDGGYLLYLFYVKLYQPPEIKINIHEHTAFQWVSFEEFMNLNLLISQGLAFNLVKDKLKNISCYFNKTY